MDRSDWTPSPSIFNTAMHGNRPVCHTPYPPSYHNFSVGAKPLGNSDRCLPPRLVEHQRVCQPPVEPDRQNPSEVAGTKQHSVSLDNATVAIPGIVSSGDGPIDRHSTTPFQRKRPDKISGGESVLKGNPGTSHVRISKQSYSSQKIKISESASKLLLASWREKLSKSYHSLFKRWVSWCQEIQIPFCPLYQIFVADLHDKGNSYRSLNSYCSAISSSHDKIDGMTVGQHPLVCRLLAECLTPTHLNCTCDVNVVINQ